MKNKHLYRVCKTANLRLFYCPAFLLALAVGVLPVKAADLCDPQIELTGSEEKLSQILTQLAEEYEFKLSFPMSLDRPIRINRSMKLNRLVKTLTTDLNTVVKHKSMDGCAVPILTEIIVLPVGQETDFATITPTDAATSEDYIYIDNMELYVTNVMNGSQQAELNRMTPEQRDEYNLVMETLKAQQE